MTVISSSSSSSTVSAALLLMEQLQHLGIGLEGPQSATCKARGLGPSRSSGPPQQLYVFKLQDSSAVHWVST
jgi:hypothetical protein